MTRSDNSSAAGREVRRLHPLTILFTLGGLLRAFAIPALVFLFVSRNDSDALQFRGLILVALTLITALARYLTFRLIYGESELIVRSGVLNRNERHIPYSRIQNIDAEQNLFHRLFGVIDITLQTAGGAEPEARLSVLSEASLAEMRERVFRGRSTAAPGVQVASDAAAESPLQVATAAERLLTIPPRDLLLHGFIENRGMVLILAAAGLALEAAPTEQYIDRLVGEELNGSGTFGRLFSGIVSTGTPDLRLLGLLAAAVLSLLLVVRLLSLVWAVVRLYDFRLDQVGSDLRIEYGLLTRVRATVPRHRIQSFTITQGKLHRLLRRASISVSTAGGGEDRGSADRAQLAPILPLADVQRIVSAIQPGLAVADTSWEAVSARAWRRILSIALVRTAVVCLILAFPFRFWVLPLALIWVAFDFVSSRKRAANLGWGLSDEVLLTREGWLSKRRTVARLSKAQVVRLTESPFDRRTGMASVSVDTAGGAVRIPYLARPTAGPLASRMSAVAASTVFRW